MGMHTHSLTDRCIEICMKILIEKEVGVYLKFLKIGGMACHPFFSRGTQMTTYISALRRRWVWPPLQLQRIQEMGMHSHTLIRICV